MCGFQDVSSFILQVSRRCRLNSRVNNHYGAVKAFMAVSCIAMVLIILGSRFIVDTAVYGLSKMASQDTRCSRGNCYAADNQTNGIKKALMFPLGMDVDRIQQEHLQRKELLNKLCKSDLKDTFLGNGPPVEERTRFIFDEGHHLLYCFIEKVGCSFWKRVFALLKDRRHNASVFNLSGVQVHRRRSSFDTVGSSPFNPKDFYSQLYTKFFFVRDPYERLFSGYIDKIFSPSFQTKTHSAVMRRHFRESPQTVAPAENVTLKTGGNSTDEAESTLVTKPGFQITQSPSCFTGASFSEFCRYLTNDIDIRLNKHYKPMYAKCSPCHVDYDFIGKMESFRDDAFFILASAGVNPKSVLGDESSFQSNNDLSIMRDLAQRTFDVIALDEGKCFRKANMLRRTWATFQMRGYLSIHSKFPVSDDEAEALTHEQFIELSRQAYGNSGSREECKRQRKTAMLEAYYSIPRELLKKVESFVEKDCKLFGYIWDVNQRFPETQRPRPVFDFDNLL